MKKREREPKNNTVIWYERCNYVHVNYDLISALLQMAARGT